MNTRLLITLLCAGAVAIACGTFTRSDSGTAEARTPAQRTTVPTTTRETPRVDGKFAVRIEPHALNFALVVSNASRKQVELAFPNGQQYDFAVLDSVGREVYRWGAGRMFTQSLRNTLIDGNDTMQVDERVEMTLPRGKYLAVATLSSTNYPIKQVSPFELR